MSETSGNPPRTIPITIICILMFAGFGASLPLLISGTARTVGAWYPPYLVLSSVIGLVCMVGLWKMRRWAVFTYTAFVVMNQAVLLSMGVWNGFALIPAIVVAILFTQISKMR
jgi:hypothetical protein